MGALHYSLESNFTLHYTWSLRMYCTFEYKLADVLRHLECEVRKCLERNLFRCFCWEVLFAKY